MVVAAHYDTRPHPDEETDPDRLKLPFLGANDFASGVALLMEIAHHLNDMSTPWGVDLVIFDGEELVYGHHPDTQGEYFLGSKGSPGSTSRTSRRGGASAGTRLAWSSTWSAAASSRSARSPTV